MNLRWIGSAVLVLGLATLAMTAETPALGLDAHRGEVVVVDFWASWCQPCRAELPWLAAMQTQLGESGLTVLTVNLDRDRTRADELLGDLGIELPIVYDPEGILAEQHALAGMPTSLFFDRAGTLRATHVGFQTEDQDELEAELEALLAEGTSSED